MPLKVQGHLKGVDQEVGLQLIYETGQRPENQITNFGLVPRQKVESGTQVTEFFNIPERFFNCMILDSQSTKSVPAGCAWPLKGMSMKFCRIKIPSQECNT